MWVTRKLGGGKLSVKFRRMLKIFQNTYANVGIKSITKQKVKMHLKFSSKNKSSEMCMYPKQNWFSALSFFFLYKELQFEFQTGLKDKMISTCWIPEELFLYAFNWHCILLSSLPYLRPPDSQGIYVVHEVSFCSLCSIFPWLPLLKYSIWYV